MTVIVTDDGFKQDDWSGGFTAFEDISNAEYRAISVSAEVEIEAIVPYLSARMIRVVFASFSDGRGLSLGRDLRIRGYQGRLRAAGDILSDQYAMARRVGFDEVEITDERAARQPEEHWLFRANWRGLSYQSKLMQTSSNGH